MSPPPECLYKTLDVSETATDADIKKAYRTLALASHPDKNRDDPTKAEELFKQIQHAYTVLSDPHERAWYDSHRAEILNSSSGAASSATSVDLFSYFSPTAYSKFDDSPTGFFSVYAKLFETLWEEEVSAGRSGPSPIFGTSKDPWSVVRVFYAHWDAFISVKSFAYSDKWRLSEAPNRDYRRAMERENRRERAKAKKEFNANIRELVAYVKKRDPRVARRKEEEAREKELAETRFQQRAEEKKRERAKDAERTRAARDEALEEDAEGLDEILATMALDEERDRQRGRRRGKKKNRGIASEEEEQSEEGERNEVDEQDIDENLSGEGLDDEQDEQYEQEETESEEELENLYCAACRKPFRTPAQMEDHERSKKHKTAIAKLRTELLAEDDAFAASMKEELPTEPNESLNEMENDISIPTTGLSKKAKKKARRRNAVSEPSPIDTLLDEETPTKPVEEDELNEEPLEEKESKDTLAESDTPKMSKKAKRKLREARKKATALTSDPASLKCNVCATEFPSRTQLMRHVSAAGHALHVDTQSR